MVHPIALTYVAHCPQILGSHDVCLVIILQGLVKLTSLLLAIAVSVQGVGLTAAYCSPQWREGESQNLLCADGQKAHEKILNITNY